MDVFICELPMHIFERILYFIPDPEDKISLGQVNQKLSQKTNFSKFYQLESKFIQKCCEFFPKDLDDLLDHYPLLYNFPENEHLKYYLELILDGITHFDLRELLYWYDFIPLDYLLLKSIVWDDVQTFKMFFPKILQKDRIFYLNQIIDLVKDEEKYEYLGYNICNYLMLELDPNQQQIMIQTHHDFFGIREISNGKNPCFLEYRVQNKYPNLIKAVQKLNIPELLNLPYYCYFDGVNDIDEKRIQLSHQLIKLYFPELTE